LSSKLLVLLAAVGAALAGVTSAGRAGHDNILLHPSLRLVLEALAQQRTQLVGEWRRARSIAAWWPGR